MKSDKKKKTTQKIEYSEEELKELGIFLKKNEYNNDEDDGKKE